MRDAALKNLIQTCPGWPDVDAVAAYAWATTPSIVGRGLVPLWQVKKALVESGEWPAIVAGQQHETPAIAALCVAIVSYVDDPRFDNIDLDLASTQQMLGGVVTAGLVSSDTAAALDAMGNGLASPLSAAGLLDPGFERFRRAVNELKGGA